MSISFHSRRNCKRCTNKHVHIAVILSVFNLALGYLAHGFFWEASMNFIAQIGYGNISSHPNNFWLSETLLFQAPIVGYISNYLPNVAVLGVYFLIIRFCCYLILTLLLIRLFSRSISNICLLVLFTQIAWYLLLGSNTTYFHVDRDGMFLTTFSTLLYLDIYFFDNKKSRALVLLFFWGCLLRLATGLIGLFVVTCFVFLWSRNTQKVFTALKTHWLVLIIISSVFFLYRLNSTNPSSRIEQYYEYALMDRQAIMPISTMKNKADSIRYRALTQFFWVADSTQFSVSFLDKLVDKSKFGLLIFAKSDFEHFKNTINHLDQNGLKLCILFQLILLIVIWRSNRRTIVNVLTFNALCTVVIFLLATRLNLYDRVLQPIISISFLCSMLLIFYNQTSSIDIFKKVLVALIILPVFLLHIVVTSDIVEREKEKNRQCYAFLNRLHSLTNITTPILWDSVLDYLPTDILSVNESKVLKKAPFMNNTVLAYLDFSQKKIIDKFGFSPLDWPSMAKVLKARNDNSCMIVSDQFAEFIEIYFRELYGLDFKLEKVKPINEIIPNNFVYKVASTTK